MDINPAFPCRKAFFYGGNMTRLPDRNLLEGTKQPDTTTGEFRLAMGNLQQFIADLLGTDSAEKQTARNIFGVQEKYRAEASGTPDELAATFDQTITRPIHGMHVQLRAGAPNTSAAPTFRADETGAIPIVKGNGLPLLPGDIAGDGHWLELKYDAKLEKWVLENPAFGIAVMPVVNEKADKWEIAAQLARKLDKSEKLPVGTLIGVGGNFTPEGYLYCNGASLSASAYPELCAVIGGTYGGDGLTTFNLPDLRRRWMQGNDRAGQVLAAGLPNITGELANPQFRNGFNGGSFNGAFYQISVYNNSFGDSGNWNSPHVGFSASRSNPIYGASDTVCPPSVTVRYCIKY